MLGPVACVMVRALANGAHDRTREPRKLMVHAGQCTCRRALHHFDDPRCQIAGVAAEDLGDAYLAVYRHRLDDDVRHIVWKHHSAECRVFLMSGSGGACVLKDRSGTLVDLPTPTEHTLHTWMAAGRNGAATHRHRPPRCDTRALRASVPGSLPHPSAFESTLSKATSH